MQVAIYDQNHGIVMANVIDIVKPELNTACGRELARLNAVYGRAYGESRFRKQIAVQGAKTAQSKIKRIIMDYDFDAQEIHETNEMLEG